MATYVRNNRRAIYRHLETLDGWDENPEFRRRSILAATERIYKNVQNWFAYTDRPTDIGAWRSGTNEILIRDLANDD